MPECGQADRCPRILLTLFEEGFHSTSITHVTFIQRISRTHYRDFVQLVEIMGIIQEQLQLDEIPHYSTLCKFSKRVPATVLNQLFRKACSFMTEWKSATSIVAIDSSGFTPDSSSTYYSARTGKTRHDYLKTSISVDSDHISLLAFHVTKSRRHDSQIAPIVLRASNRVKKSRCYVMDKGYDSERIHQLIHEDLESQSMIPIRDWHASYVSGKYRQIMATPSTQKPTAVEIWSKRFFRS